MVGHLGLPKGTPLGLLHGAGSGMEQQALGPVGGLHAFLQDAFVAADGFCSYGEKLRETPCTQLLAYGNSCLHSCMEGD